MIQRDTQKESKHIFRFQEGNLVNNNGDVSFYNIRKLLN